ncbi:hypothetical protein ACFLUU_04265 [Chloroflexota bacterium]
MINNNIVLKFLIWLDCRLGTEPQLHTARIASLLLKLNPNKKQRAVIAKDLTNSYSGLMSLVRWGALIEPEEKKDAEVGLRWTKIY